ncbi:MULTISPECIES: AAA family ATPase [unclassified Neisseria]|uniref:AAA family ATPase n=1 Tax=unclassified Neisseria TaxID=2623750 RepID=UPI0026655200|nr:MULTISPECIES: AAA family ATPase [unclassified Neisseria]MDO1509858.1 AAA family ATPase [Neisseria sp. MVDL19-042950]MDO1516056.1 AAA family ATPase [Neisseria sp. MVDL18-041461]MDO1563171.1 AAA family ATPase [Neisseria sp. MVDL20-010259]
MKITQIIIENFKSFANRTVLNTDKPIVCFVGENNTGKTTIFRALDFLRNGVVKDTTITDYKNIHRQDHNLSVEITIQGNLTASITNFAEEKYLNYIERDHNGNEKMRLRRSSEVITITQNNRQIELNEKKICIYNPNTQQFENPTGFDKAIGSLFDNIFVWSEMNADDVVDFGSTKIFGKLLKEVSNQFEQSQDWADFTTAHQIAFVTGANSLRNQSQNLMSEVESALSNFYGNAQIKLDFSIPDPASFIKLGNVIIDDGMETPLTEKGSGMQRAFALSVIKVYANYLCTHPANPNLIKPLFFFIDEPEISLHPKAQYMLISALNNISTQQQVFITTHSAYLLSMFQNQNTAILITTKNNHQNSVVPVANMNTFPFSPTLAEIEYFAFDIISNDFHNELYGFIEEKIIKKGFNFDAWLNTNCSIQINKTRTRIRRNGSHVRENTTLMTYIRHAIHHPENTLNPNFTEVELQQSIQEMLNILQDPNFLAL